MQRQTIVIIYTAPQRIWVVWEGSVFELRTFVLRKIYIIRHVHHLPGNDIFVNFPVKLGNPYAGSNHFIQLKETLLN